MYFERVLYLDMNDEIRFKFEVLDVLQLIFDCHVILTEWRQSV